MGRVLERSKMLGQQLRSGDVKGAAGDVAGWVWSEQTYIGMYRDLRARYEPPAAKIDLRVVPLDDKLALRVFSFDGLGERDKTYLERRRRFWAAGFDNGFVALAPDDSPAYLQWLIPPSQAEKIEGFFGPVFPSDGETLFVEGAWIPPAHRKSRVMGQGLSMVTEAAAEATPSATGALCFVESGNPGAIKGSRAGGYEIDRVRRDSWRFGQRHVEFEPATPASLGYD